MKPEEQAFRVFLRRPWLVAVVGAGAAAGLLAANLARRSLAPLLSDAELFSAAYVMAPSTAYPQAMGRPIDVMHASCSRLYTSYETFTQMIHRQQGKLVAVCQAKLHFQQCEAIVSLHMTRSADLEEPWRVYKFDVSC
jgi:hypothetical protein